MPMSPSSFVPSERLQPGDGAYSQAPQVAPEHNYAPQQIENMGQAVSNAGGLALRTGQSMAYRIGETIDDANTKAAETGFLTAATGVTRGYLETIGKDAMDGYAGATQDLAKAADKGREGLTNPIQQRMYNQAVAQHLVSFGGQMADHNHQQTVHYSASESNDRSDKYAQQAALAYKTRDAVDSEGKPTGDYQAFVKTATDEAMNAAQIGLGAPPGSAQSNHQVQQTTTKIAVGVIAQLMNDHANVEAQDFFDKEWKAGRIDGDMAVKLSGMIRTQAERDDINDTTNNMIQTKLASHAPGAPPTRTVHALVDAGSINQTMGPRADGTFHNGIDIGVPVGTAIYAPMDGTVIHKWDDQVHGGGLSMEIKHDDGSITGVAHLSSSSYEEGMHVTQGQVMAYSGGAKGAPGSGDSTGPHVHWIMKDPNGNYIDPRTAGGVPQKLENFTNPNDLDDLLQQVDASDKSPYQKKELKTQLESQYRHYRQIDDQKYEDLKKGVVDSWYAVDGDVSKFNPAQLAQFSQLRPGDQAQLKKGIPRESDEDTVLKLIANPNLVVPGSIEGYRDQLSKGDYRQFFGQAQKNGQPDSPNTRAVTMDNDQLDSILQGNGLQGLVSPKANTPESARKIDLVTDIRNKIDEAQAHGEVTRDQKYKIMTGAIADQTQKAKVDSTFQKVLMWPFAPLGSGTEIPYAQMTPSQRAQAYVTVGDQKVTLNSIPPADRTAISLTLQRNNQPVTFQNMAEMYVAKQRKDKLASPAQAPQP